MHARQFWWAWLFRFRRYGYLSKTAKFPFWGMDYSPWFLKNLIDWNRLKKFMQVGIDVKCMHTDFGGHGLSSFGDKISLFSIKMKKFNRSESAQKIHASRGQCHVHVHQIWWAWFLWYQRYGYLSKQPNFPFEAWTIVHGHQKIELIGIGSKNHASRDRYQVHAYQFWLGVVSPVSEILLPFKNGQISLLGHGL